MCVGGGIDVTIPRISWVFAFCIGVLFIMQLVVVGCSVVFGFYHRKDTIIVGAQQIIIIFWLYFLWC